MQVQITFNSIKGNIGAIPSKSDAHRAVICAGLANADTKIYMPLISKDIEATINCMNALGASIKKDGDVYDITPIGEVLKGAVLDCGESGSTLRFLLPVAAALGADASFLGSGRLPERPIGLIVEVLKEKGIVFDGEKLPLCMKGKTKNGEFSIDGGVSSQFISGLLLSMPLILGDNSVKLLSDLKSAAYVDMTLDTMARFGVRVEKLNDGYRVLENQSYITPGEYVVEGDWSNSAFFLVAGALRGEVTLKGLDLNSKQSDKAIIDILKLAGVNLNISEEGIRVTESIIKPFSADVSQCPDLFPIMAVLACGATGKSELYNAKRLRIKESDRIKTTKELILNLGGFAEETEDSLIIHGTEKLFGGKVNSYNDHRIAMSASVAALLCEESVIIEDAEAVEKSYPYFYEDLKKAGGNVNVI